MKILTISCIVFELKLKQLKELSPPTLFATP